MKNLKIISNLKKFLIYFFLISLIIVIPALLTRRNVKTLSEKHSTDNKENVNIEKYDYSKYKTIKLYHTKEDRVEELPLDEYLYGVVSAEMPAKFELEALKAQAVAARTYTIYKIENGSGKHNDKNADICDDSTCCQAWISKENRLNKWDENNREEYWEKIVEAVDSTQGKIITYENAPINAFFHSNSGGITEVVSNVWGGKDLPYLKSVETSGEDEYSQYASEVNISRDDLISKIKERYNDIKIDFEEEDCIKVIEYTESKRVKTVKFGNKNLAGTEVRSILGLKSTNFNIKIDEDNVIFSVIGYGHGVGMSQTGADSMAKQGCNYEEILKHFYTGVEISGV